MEGLLLAWVGLTGGEGVKIVCAQLALDDLQQNKKVSSFLVLISSTGLILLWAEQSIFETRSSKMGIQHCDKFKQRFEQG